MGTSQGVRDVIPTAFRAISKKDSISGGSGDISKACGYNARRGLARLFSHSFSERVGRSEANMCNYNYSLKRKIPLFEVVVILRRIIISRQREKRPCTSRGALPNETSEVVIADPLQLHISFGQKPLRPVHG
jgi:hypothetical protein